ncbi:MAG: hypothetical protein AAF797_00220 [Planctomycetota bacterium]
MSHNPRKPKASIRWSNAIAPALAATLCLLLLTPGCRTKGQGQGPLLIRADSEARPNPEPDVSGAWYPIPNQLRIFPTTRFITERGRPVLEARIELLDAMGHALKTSGQFRFELFAAPPDADRASQKLYTWNHTLRTADHQREHFDPVTFAYRFQLELRDEALKDKPTVLRVTFTPPAGPRLTVSHGVRTDW